MHTADTTSLEDPAIEDDDAVLIDTTDPSTYTVWETAADIAAALAEAR